MTTRNTKKNKIKLIIESDSPQEEEKNENGRRTETKFLLLDK